MSAEPSKIMADIEDPVIKEMLVMLKRLGTISTLDEKWDRELQDLIAKVEGRE